ncbi:hypothetical protein ABZ619_43460 [Streptomyces sp. NPDC007851]|uniref:hypothetical protein n=1 Tax=Streptomyces sp. NPDC007851 TaxID=3155008 RepID=UPI0033DE4A28
MLQYGLAFNQNKAASPAATQPTPDPYGVVEEAQARREQDAAVRHWIRDEDELD